jgi:hypothetical protein
MFFAQRAISSTRSIGVFFEVFLKLENVLHGEVLFSRGKRGFLARLFAVGLFLMIISSQGISWPDCRLSLRESSASSEFGFRGEKARVYAPLALT